MPKAEVLDFGIPKLDMLLGKAPDQEWYGLAPDSDGYLSISLVGEEGSGKSVLALHLVSRFLALNRGPLCIYFSEDLSFQRAKKVYQAFGLDNAEAVAQEYRNTARRTVNTLIAPIDVTCDSGEVQLSRSTGFQFVDLASSTCGDHWKLILHSIASLDPNSSKPVLIVVDNLDALQCINGGRDEFGEPRSRWNRVDQLLMTARQAKGMIVLISETAPHVPENAELYAADYVVQLSQGDPTKHYMSRSVIVRKARGQANVGGFHTFGIRDGKGTTTGYQDNGDNLPRRRDENDNPRWVSSISVFHSLDYTYHQHTAQAWDGFRPVSGSVLTTFNELSGLNELLLEGGIRGGSALAIVGGRQSFKSYLTSALGANRLSELNKDPYIRARKQLSSHGASFARAISHNTDPQARVKAYRDYRKNADRVWQTRFKGGLRPTIMHFNTEDVDSWVLAGRMAPFLGIEPGTLERLEYPALAWIESCIQCRRLDIHSNTPAALFEVFVQCVEDAIRKASGVSDLSAVPTASRGQVFVAITDWAQLVQRFPEVSGETKFLPLLLFHLRRMGVAVAITETRSDALTLPSVFQGESILAQNCDRAVFLWRVPGDSRLAITTAPQAQAESGTLVRELRRKGNILEVDDGLERYQGFELGEPRLVKLFIRVLGQTPSEQDYARAMGKWLGEVLHPEDPTGTTVTCMGELEYQSLKDIVTMTGSTRLGHTEIFMVDGFWNGSQTLQSFEKANLIESHKHLLSISKDRFHYTKDYGFLLVPSDVWRRCYGLVLPFLSRSKDKQHYPRRDHVRFVAEALRFARRKPGSKFFLEVDGARNGKAGPYQRDIYPGIARVLRRADVVWDLLGWRVFLQTCCEIAESEKQDGLVPFDLDITASEALNALILEVWMSEIQYIVRRYQLELAQLYGSKFSDSFASYSTEKTETAPISPTPPGMPIHALLAYPIARVALFFAMGLLAQVMTEEQWKPDPTGFDIAPRRAFPAVAVRHWYTTAVRDTVEAPTRNLTALRLPGHYSTRGDWFLGVARGSRSMKVALDAIGHLSSNRGRFDRLQAGVGLPPAKFIEEDYVRTALRVMPGAGTRPSMTLENLLGLGANGTDFWWLFRGKIGDYDWFGTVFRKWAFRVIGDWIQKKRPDHASVFEMYDAFFQVKRSVDDWRQGSGDWTKAESRLSSAEEALRHLIKELDQRRPSPREQAEDQFASFIDSSRRLHQLWADQRSGGAGT